MSVHDHKRKTLFLKNFRKSILLKTEILLIFWHDTRFTSSFYVGTNVKKKKVRKNLPISSFLYKVSPLCPLHLHVIAQLPAIDQLLHIIVSHMRNPDVTIRVANVTMTRHFITSHVRLN